MHYTFKRRKTKGILKGDGFNDRKQRTYLKTKGPRHQPKRKKK